jgi:hypothetical protein
MKTDANKDTWCVNAEHALRYDNSGSANTCCMVEKDFNTLSGHNGDNWSSTTKTIQEVFNNPWAEKLRNNLRKGIRDPNCTKCWREEDAGRASMRVRDNNHWKNESLEGLARIELNLGNLCNIKCKTCGPRVSSSWLSEGYWQSQSVKTFKEYAENHKIYSQSFDDDSPFWPDLEANLGTFRDMKFYGGEPFMSKKMWRVLKLAVDNDFSKNIELSYATNGTLWPEETALFNKFKKTGLIFSIDGIGKQFESMRYLAKWDVVQENMNRAIALRGNQNIISLGWCITLSALNIYYLPEILAEWESNWKDKRLGYYLNLVHLPTYFSLVNLPNNVKEKVIAKLETSTYAQTDPNYRGIIDFIKLPQETDNWAEFNQNINLQNEFRKESYQDIFPEYAKILGI